MPLSTAQLTELQTASVDLSAIVGALVADTDPHPLQAELDAAVAAVTADGSDITAVIASAGFFRATSAT